MISMLLFYFIIVLFLCYTFKNKKPREMLHDVLTFSQETKEADTFRIPGPIRLPWPIGTKWNMLTLKMNKLHEYYSDLNHTYGDVVMEMAGDIPVISLFNRKDIEKVLKYHSKHPFRPPNEIVTCYRKTRPDRYSSVGLVNSQGEEWGHLRKNLTPKTLENRKILAEFCPELNQITDDFIKQIRERRNEEKLCENVDDLLKSMSFESGCCLILGRRMGFLGKTVEGSEAIRKLSVAAKNVLKYIRDAYYGKSLKVESVKEFEGLVDLQATDFGNIFRPKLSRTLRRMKKFCTTA